MPAFSEGFKSLEEVLAVYGSDLVATVSLGA